MSFDEFELSELTQRGLKDSGYTTPTEVQVQSLKHSLKGEDVLGAAKTGSGKTLAFVIPLLELLYREQWSSMDGLGALIITPTRELAYQIFEVLRKVGRYHDFSAGLVIGGKDLKFEQKRLYGCSIVVCTPGRLLQHMDTNVDFSWDQLKILILDEADRILDLGFSRDMNAIIDNLPTERQTLLFSATQTKSVKDLARLSLKSPAYVSVHEASTTSTPEGWTQSYVVCELDDKLNMLFSFLKSHKWHKILVFMATCKQVKYTHELFQKLKPGIGLLALYGSLHQLKRMEIYDQFQRRKHGVFTATDITARGLDFPEINWVIQLDCPEDVTTYIHRAGRTARLAKNGEALLVVMPSEEESMIEQLKSRKIPIDKIEISKKKMIKIQKRTEICCAKSIPLKESAQRAYKSYLKNIFLMKDKSIFKFEELNQKAYALSLGLVVAPRVRFLENKSKSKKKNVKVIEEKQISKPTNDGKVSLLDADGGDSDDDIFTVKSQWRPEDGAKIDENLIKEQLEALKNATKKEKVVTKVQAAKKVLKKKIALNTKVVFDEDGQAKPADRDMPLEQTSAKLKELDASDVRGINVELAKEVMRDEDVIDKELAKKFKKERKLKLKAKRKAKEGEEKATLLQYSDDDDGEDRLDDLIDALPDPDKVYGDRSNNSNAESDDGDSVVFDDEEQSDDGDDVRFDDESSEENDEGEQVQLPKSKQKRKAQPLQTKIKNKLLKISDVSEQENLVLHLLGSK